MQFKELPLGELILGDLIFGEILFEVKSFLGEMKIR
jgi:hypothetical protein